MSKWQYAFVLIAFGLSTEILASQQIPVVQTTKGPVQGEILCTLWQSKRYSSFKGIPYARSPTGYLRFKPPVEVEPWTKTFVATKEGSPCPQLDFLQFNKFIGSEDCLFLNVYTPWTDFNRSRKDFKDVMVWIYGGGFMSGYANASLYGPELILQDDVVLVTFNYRLGPLGFLSAGHPNATGNAGLKDQNFALKWVQENIANFGGNPKSVTIFGESAGAASVDYHVLSDMSRGLFHRSISMSGSVLLDWAFHTPSSAKDMAFELAAKLGRTSANAEDLLAHLYHVSVGDLIIAAASLSPYSLLLHSAFKPTLEDPTLGPKEAIFLSECSVNKYMKGNFSQLPHMMGYTAHEGILVAGSEDQLRMLIQYSDSSIENLGLKSLLDPFVSNNWLLPAEDLLRKTSIMNIVDAASDLTHVAVVEMKREMLNLWHNAPLYYYRISYDSEYSFHKIHFNINLNGTSHFDDVPLIFHTNFVKLPLDENDPFSVVRKRMVRMWTNFAKYSNPTPLANDPVLPVNWPASGDSGMQLDINEKLLVRDDLITPRAKFYAFGFKTKAAILNGC